MHKYIDLESRVSCGSNRAAFYYNAVRALFPFQLVSSAIEATSARFTLRKRLLRRLLRPVLSVDIVVVVLRSLFRRVSSVRALIRRIGVLAVLKHVSYTTSSDCRAPVLRCQVSPLEVSLLPHFIQIRLVGSIASSSNDETSNLRTCPPKAKSMLGNAKVSGAPRVPPSRRERTTPPFFN